MSQLNLFSLPQLQPYHYRTGKVILERFCAGESIKELAIDYCTEEIHIQDTLRQEVNLKLAPKSVAHLKKMIAKYIPGEVPSSKFKKLLFIIRYACEKGYEDKLPDWVEIEYKKQLGLFLEGMGKR